MDWINWIMESAKGFLKPKADKDEIDPGSASKTAKAKPPENGKIEDHDSADEVKVPKQKIGLVRNLLNMFRASSPRDKMILTLGVIFAIIHGASYPIMALLIGSISETFIAQAHRGYSNSSYTVSNNSTVIPSITANTTTEEPNPIVEIFEYIGNLFGLSSTTEEIMRDEEFAARANKFSMYFIVLAVVVSISTYMQTWCFESTADNQIAVVRKNLIKQILRQESTWFEKNQAGLLIAKLTDDVERFREGIGYKFSLVLEYLSAFAIGLFFGFCTNSKLTLVLGISVPFIIGKILYLGKVFAAKAIIRQEKYGEAGSLSEEVIAEVRTVAALGGETTEQFRYEDILAENFETAKKDYNYIGFGTGVLYVIIYGTFVTAVLYASNQLLQNHISRQQVYTVFCCVTLAIVALSNILPYISDIAYSHGCLQSIGKVTKHKPSIDPYDAGGFKPHKFKENIKFRDVMFSYPARQDALVLRDFNLTLTPGAPVGILGGSGVGKSTIVNLLMRFYDPTSGTITFDDFKLKQLNLRWLRDNVGVVNSEPTFLNDTIYHNITCRRKIKREEIMRATRVAGCHRQIMDLPNKYKTVIGAGGRELSASLRQLIAIVRLLVQKPKVIILDEGLSAQTSITRPKLMENLQKATRGCSLVMFSHHIFRLRMPGCIIHVLEDGNIVEVGQHEELMKREGVYYKTAVSQNIKPLRNEPESETPTEAPAEIEDTEESGETDEPPGVDESVTGDDSEDDTEYLHETKFLDQMSKKFGYRWKDDSNVYLGILGCVISGVVPPLGALVFCQLLIAFSETGLELTRDSAFWAKVLFGIGIATGIGYWMRTAFINNVGESMTRILRGNFYLTILRQGIPWFDDKNHSPERLNNMLSRHVPVFKVAIGGRLGVVISAIISYITAIVISFLIEWRLALVIVAVIPVQLFVIYKETEIYGKIKLRIFDKMDDAYSIASESVKEIRTIQSFSLQSTTLEKFTKSSSVFQEKLKDESEHIGISFGIAEALPFVTFAAIFRVGAYKIISGSVASIDIFKVFIVLVFSTSTIGHVTAFIPDYVKAKLAFAYLFAFCDTDSTIDVLSDEDGERPLVSGRITFENVFFSYENRLGADVLRGVSFDLKPGTILGICGSPGKSTILSLLLRFYECYDGQGQVMIDGIDVQKFNLMHLRSNIGYVDQNPKLLNRSIRENILYGYGGLEEGEELQKRIEETIDSLFLTKFIDELPKGYDTIVGPHGSRLTNGQRQLIAIVRAVIRDPKILLLDMPTSALDSELEMSMATAFKKIAVGRTRIIIANHPNIIRHTNCIAVLRNGQIADFGTHEGLVNSKGAYSDFLHAAQLASHT